MSDPAPPQNPIPSLPSPSSPIPRSWKKSLEDNALWVSLALVVVSAVSAVYLLLFFEDRVEKQVDREVPRKVTEIFYADSWNKERRDAEVKARNAFDDATLLQQTGQQKVQSALDEALRAAEDANRLANELRIKLEQANNIVDIDKINSKIDAMLNDPEIRKEIVLRVLPPQSVIAFDKSDGCPIGWSNFKEVGSRVIVGAGPNSNLDMNSKPLTNYHVGASGGEEKHTLTLPEMPSHVHALEGFSGIQVVGGDRGTLALIEPDSSRSKFGGGTGAVGGDTPHNIMPPFYALFYCKRDS